MVRLLHFVKGNADDDSITGADDTAAETIYGGQGNDTIVHANTLAGANSARMYYGDKGDDSLTVNSNISSKIDGGDGADTITMTQVATTDNTNSVDGGSGADVIQIVASVASKNLANSYAVEDTATRRTIHPSLSSYLRVMWSIPFLKRRS